MRLLLAVVIALSSMTALQIVTIQSADAAWRKHYRSSSHNHRGETCWRTNRATGAHFRIC
jgi:type II secretory pathway component PulJ